MRICCFPFLCFEEEKEDNKMDNDDPILLSREDLSNVGEEEQELGLQEGDEKSNRKRVNDDGEKGEDLVGWIKDSGFLNSGFQGEASSSSSSIAVTERGNCSDDTQNKRAKFHYVSLELGTDSGKGIHCFAPVLELDEWRDLGTDSGKGIHYSAPVRELDYEDVSGPNEEATNSSDTLVAGDTMEVRMDFSNDILHTVFSFLNHIDLCRTAQVCKQWRDVSSHEDLWRYLNFANRPISEQQFVDMCHRYPNANALNAYGTPAIHTLGMIAVSLLRNLEVLTLGKGQLGEAFFQAVTDCHMLRSLTINDATLGTGLQEIPIYHDRLHVLQMVKCRVLRLSIKCPQLETLSLKRSSMPNVVLDCPLLRQLDIASCHKLTDSAIRLSATSCPLLESLDMSNCSCVSDETLREIASSCRHLRVLDASYCPNISLEHVTLALLTVLKLHSCEGITSASMAAIARSEMLEVLELDNCGSLISVSLDLPRLQSIRLVHCRKFVELNLRSSVLSSIAVSNCPSLQTINITSHTLKKLVLQKQESLNKLALQCDCLQEVNLTECESLTDSICEVFNSGRGCPVLRSLILDSCESLTAVSFSSTSLVSLSLGGCRAITSLDVSCPYLEHVSLVGCDHLERATFSPVGLKSLNLGICPKLIVLHIHAPEMVSLELKGCGVLSEAVIDCPLLTSLDASFCCQLTDESLSTTTSLCPLIESLVLMSCHHIGPDGLSSLHRLQRLIYLDLSYNFLEDLQPVFVSCLYLKVLKLQACKYLSHASLEPIYKHNALPALCELDLSYGTLCQSAMEELLTNCRRLTHISLNGCFNMHDFDWGLQAEKFTPMSTLYGPSLENPQGDRLLQNLNCVGCPNIKKVVIPPSARCVHLTSLNLSLSSNLKEVDISCCNLLILNLSNCTFLEILKLDCPRLTSLFLQSSNIDEEAVEDAIAQCSVLETLDVRFCPKVPPSSMGGLRAACPSLKRIYSSLPPA